MSETCPDCGSEMNKKYIKRGNALFLSTVKTTYEFYECPNCPYKTSEVEVDRTPWWDGTPPKDDEDDE